MAAWFRPWSSCNRRALARSDFRLIRYRNPPPIHDPSMTDRKTDRVVSITLSILAHAALVSALVWGWFHYRQPPATPPSLAIEGTVVRGAVPPPPPPEPTPPKPVEQPAPPAPTADEEEQRKKVEAQKAAEAVEQQQKTEKAVADK